MLERESTYPKMTTLGKKQYTLNPDITFVKMYSIQTSQTNIKIEMKVEKLKLS